MESKNKSLKVAFLTLGCKVNQYESNAMAQKFLDAGYSVCGIKENPDVIIVNTCTVTNIADRKSRHILRKVKEENKNSIVVAVGCYVQVAKEKVDEIEEIDLSLGNVEKKDIVQIIECYIENKKRVEKIIDVNKEKEFLEMGLNTYTEKTRATIKIQDGCNNFCTYCLIPFARGRIRSRSKENVIKEVEQIAKKGIKEVVLTGIHIASYGKENKENNYFLIDLLEDLNKIQGIERIRLGSLEPTIITEEFAKRLSKLEKICNQFHLSLQSGCDETLKRMNRKYTTKQFEEVAQILRKYFKDVNLTTDIIVGFPGETDEEFEQTYNFLKNISFYKMHIFKYSPREGTLAQKMPMQVDGNKKEERSEKLIELSNINQEMYNKKYINKKIMVLFEEKVGDYWEGYTKNYIRVKVKTEENLENKLQEVVPIKEEKQILIAKI